mgnify:CR=1 FL=1
MRTKHTRRCLAVVLAAVLLLGAAVGAVFWNRHRGATSVAVETTQENAAEQVVFFRQKDDRWNRTHWEILFITWRIPVV